MRIFRAIGLVLFLIAVKILMSEVFNALESALVSFFEATQRFAEYIGPGNFSAATFEAMAPQIPHY